MRRIARVAGRIVLVAVGLEMDAAGEYRGEAVT
jgi:hypothetical protein